MRKSGGVSDQGYWNFVHPKLKKLGRKQIQNFLTAREQDLLRIQDAGASVHSLPTISLISLADHVLLLSFIKFD